jgi:hypothetical protein
MTDSNDHHLIVFDPADGALQKAVTRNMTLAGQAANHHAARGVFADYLSRKADNTIRRQAADLARFADYLNAIGDRPVWNWVRHWLSLHRRSPISRMVLRLMLKLGRA